MIKVSSPSVACSINPTFFSFSRFSFAFHTPDFPSLRMNRRGPSGINWKNLPSQTHFSFPCVWVYIGDRCVCVSAYSYLLVGEKGKKISFLV